jgi:hypothetical protein
MLKKVASVIVLIIVLISCKSSYYNRKIIVYSKPVDTSDKNIQLQKKGVFTIENIQVDNRFDGARMNHFFKANDTLFQIDILPENEPVNPSPWYAFQINSKRRDTVINLKINYPGAKHRYYPKISSDRLHWKKIHSDSIVVDIDKKNIILKLHLHTKPVWIAAQTLINSHDVQRWIQTLESLDKISEVQSVGKSVLNRNIPFFKIGKNLGKKKNVIVLLSRQHPPEVTGFKALQYFIDELLQENRLTTEFYKHNEIWVFPLLNPDGVDLGHWRHNAHGVDLNRDWAYYKQPEIEQVTNFIVTKARREKAKVILGIDFHSTFKDVYYVYNDSIQSVLPGFHTIWTGGIDALVYPFATRYAPGGMSSPVSKNWFFNQFKAEGITYEVGDETPEKIIRDKAKKAAVLLMTILTK